MNIVRKYKIHLLNINCLTKKELNDLNIILKYINYSKENEIIIDFIYNNLLNLKKYTLHKGSDTYIIYKNSIFYSSNNKIEFEYDLKLNKLYYDIRIHSFLYRNNFNNIRFLIKDIFKEFYIKNNDFSVDYISMEFLKSYNFIEVI